MSTGIGFLDNLIKTVNTGIKAIDTGLTNAQSYITQTTTQATNQLTNFVQGISNGISGITQGVQTPLVQPGTTYSPQIYNPYGNQYVQYQQPQQLGGYLTVPTQTNITLSGFDFNTVYAAVNAAFQNLPAIVATIQNPLQSPLMSNLINLIQHLYDSQAQTVDQVKQLVQGITGQFYQSTSTILGNIGIDTGQFSNLLDASVRIVMENLGYDFNARMAQIEQMNKDGLADLNQKIYSTQSGINQLLQSLTYTTDVIRKQQEELANVPDIGATVPAKDLIQQAVDSAGSELQRVLAETIDYALDNPNSFVQQLSGRINDISSVIADLKAGKYKSSDEFFNAIFGNQPATGIARGLIILASVIPTLIAAVNAAGEPALEAFTHLINADSPVKLLSPSDYITAYYKKAIGFEYMSDKLRKQGISDENIKILLDASITDPDFGTMIQAKRRGFIDEGEWSDYILDQHLDSRSKEIIEQVMNVLPNPQDLTRIADKRIWSAKLDPKYGQFAELPDQYRDYMAQQGFDPKFTEWFWAAHWNLPSPQQIFEMFHRGFINQDDMQAYLNLTDWLPFFRDKLLQISYNPLTRVDIRRIYGLGMFDRNELVRRYQYIGFSPADSQIMADFTVKYEGSDGTDELDKLKNKIVTAVQNLYIRRKISRDEALNRLVALGKDRQFSELSLNYLEFEGYQETVKPKLEAYKTKAITLVVGAYLKGHYAYDDAIEALIQAGLTQDVAAEELKYADIERQVKVTEEIINAFEIQYVNGIISQADYIARISELGLNAGEINQAVIEAETKIQKRFKMPTEKQVITWYQNSLIDEDYVVKYLQAVGYPDSVIPLILAGDFGVPS